MTPRPRAVVRGLTLALAATTALAAAVPASAAQARPAASPARTDRVATALATSAWAPEHDTDGTVLVRLGRSDAGTGGVVLDGSLLGEVVVVPGDSGGTSFRVRNEGPTSGTLVVTVVNAVALHDTDSDDWVDDAFYDDLTVNGVPASELEGRRTVVHEAELARGASVDVPVTYAFDGWTGNRTGGGLHSSGVIVHPDGVGPRSFAFDLMVRIAGDAASPGGTDGTDSSDPAARDAGTGSADGTSGTRGGDAAAGTDGSGGATGTSGAVARTGGAGIDERGLWLLLVAGGLVVVAASGARVLRRSGRSGPSQVGR